MDSCLASSNSYTSFRTCVLSNSRRQLTSTPDSVGTGVGAMPIGTSTAVTPPMVSTPDTIGAGVDAAPIGTTAAPATELNLSCNCRPTSAMARQQKRAATAKPSFRKSQ